MGISTVDELTQWAKCRRPKATLMALILIRAQGARRPRQGATQWEWFVSL